MQRSEIDLQSTKPMDNNIYSNLALNLIDYILSGGQHGFLQFLKIWSVEIISICSIFVACLALFVTVRHGKETRRHNRLSLRPHLVFEIDSRVDSGGLIISLHNHGVGPAFLKGVEYSLDGKQYEITKLDDWNPILQALSISSKASVIVLDPHAAIPSNDVKEILNFDVMVSREEAREEIRRLDIKLIYESAYEEKSVVTLNSDLDRLDI